MKSKNKILFIANKAPHYRLPFFNGLAKKENIKFIFTNEKEKIIGLDANHKVIRGKCWGKFKIHLDLVRFLKKECPNNVVMLPPDPMHLLNNLLIYRFCKKNKINFFIWTERWRYKQIPIKDKISNWLHKPLFKFVKKVFVPGMKSKEWALAQGASNSQIILVPNASEIKFNLKDKEKIKKKIIKEHELKNKKIILYLGRLIKRKGINYLIEAFSKIKNKNVILIIVGGDDFYRLGEKSIKFKLKDQVKKLGLKNKIIFTGEIKHSKTAAYYSLADLFVYPSITYHQGEPWGLALNEAMQFGLPIISTDAVGAAYNLIKEGENGFIVEEKNSEKLKIAFEKILKNEKLQKKMGEKSREIIKKEYNYERMICKFIWGLK